MLQTHVNNAIYNKYCLIHNNGVASLCNQLLTEFSNNQFETFHRCYKHIEDVHMTFNRQENHF